MPAVDRISAAQLDACDPIFASLREDYAPAFDMWLARAQYEQRPAWIILDETGGYAAVAIGKDEDDGPYGLPGRALKVATFKVADHAQGRRYGRMLLDTVVDYAERSGHDAVYVTVFARHAPLVRQLAAAGFSDRGVSPLGERVLARRCSAGLGLIAGPRL